MELKNINNLKNSINHILDSGANEIRLIEMIENYVEKNYWTSWKKGDIITNGMIDREIKSIDLCVLIDDGNHDNILEYESIKTLQDCNYYKLSMPEINPETIALKFNVDVKTVKTLLKKQIKDYE